MGAPPFAWFHYTTVGISNAKESGTFFVVFVKKVFNRAVG